MKYDGTEDQYNPGCAPGGGCCDELCLGGCTQADSADHCHNCHGLMFNNTCYSECPAFDNNNKKLYEVILRLLYLQLSLIV